MSDFLKQMARSSRERADRLGGFPADSLERPVNSLSGDGFGIIAELKDRSPAEGALKRSAVDRLAQAARYAEGGAAAISVLTEPSRFDGALEHLDAVATAFPGLPVMRKDFLVDRRQVLEARSAGASGVLLIAAMLDDGTLNDMLDCAFEHGLFVLLEAFDEDDLARCRAACERLPDQVEDRRLLVGVNTRNLRTLEVDRERLEAFAASLPDASCVAESGLRTAEDAARVAGLGYSMALVGTALMRSDAPGPLIEAMRQAGSEAMAP